MKRSSIRKRIFFNSAIIIALAIIMIIIGIYAFTKSNEFTGHILPLNRQMIELALFKSYFESFEQNLEQHFIIGGEIHASRMNKDIDNFLLTIDSLKNFEYRRELVENIDGNCLKLNDLISQLLDEDFRQSSSRKQNELIVRIYSEVDSINSLYNSLTGHNLDQLQYYIKAQQDSIKIAILVFFIFGFVMLSLYIFLGRVLSKNISDPILVLKEAATEINKGNLNVKAKVIRSDEIGELATDFNEMTAQLQNSMNDLKDSEEKFRTLAAKIPGMVFQMSFKSDGSYYFKYLSPGATEVFGLPESLENFEVGHHIHPEDREKFISSVIKAVNNKTDWNSEGRLMQQDGTIKWFHGLSSPTIIGDEIVFNGIFLDITVEKTAELEIKKSLVEKETLLQEIHHRVKNNLQVVSSIIKMESFFIKNEEVKSILNNTSARVEAMGLLHNKLYKTKDFTRIDMNDYIASIIEQLKSVYSFNFSNIKIKLEIDKIFFNIETAMPCGLIINEVITNSMKYAFPKNSNGEIGIVINENNGLFTMKIYDTGIGIPENVSFDKNSRLGLQLVFMLTKQFQGTVSIERNNGTVFIITFKQISKEEKRWG